MIGRLWPFVQVDTVCRWLINTLSNSILCHWIQKALHPRQGKDGLNTQYGLYKFWTWLAIDSFVPNKALSERRSKRAQFSVGLIYRARQNNRSHVWWLGFLLLLSTSAWKRLRHYCNLGLALKSSTVSARVWIGADKGVSYFEFETSRYFSFIGRSEKYVSDLPLLICT